MSLSAICALHCLLFPVVISLLPLLPAGSVYHEWVHPMLIALIVPVTYFAARRSHFDRVISRFLGAGIVLIVAGWIAGHHLLGHSPAGIWAESGVTLAGSLLLIIGHWRNYRHHRVCSNHRHKHHPVIEQFTDSPERTPDAFGEEEN